MMQQERLKQQQLALMQQALLQQQRPQQPLYPHPGLLAAPQIEPIPSGNLPPGFDPSACRSVYVGNIHLQVTEALLQEIFQSAGPIEGCKLIKKEKTAFGFVDYFDRGSASLAILSNNGRLIYGQPIKVNWAYASNQREDTTGHFNIFVGDLSPEVTDATLFSCFSVYPSCSDARVMWDQKTGRSRGYGFVSFRAQQDAQRAINDLNGKWLGTRQIRCNWATKGAVMEENQTITVKTVDPSVNTSVPAPGVIAEGESTNEASNEEDPENNPQYTTVYVGNLSAEVRQADLHRYFHALGAGTIEEVRLQRDKGFGFVRYSTHAEAALAIQFGNGRILYGKPIKCSWGNKPTPPGTNSTPLPPPMPAPFVGALSQADLMSYERQLALTQMSGSPAMLAQAQLAAYKQAAALGIDPTQAAALGFSAAAPGQQLYF